MREIPLYTRASAYEVRRREERRCGLSIGTGGEKRRLRDLGGMERGEDEEEEGNEMRDRGGR